MIISWNRRDSQRFTELVGELEHILHLSSHLEGWELNEISDADIFPSLDKAIITALLNSLLTRAENFDHYEETILARRTKHFYPGYEAIYDCLYWAIQLLRFSKEQGGFTDSSAESMFASYSQEYYAVDHAYRKFCLAYDRARGLDKLHRLSEEIENLYCNWYLPELAVRWSKLAEEDLADNWLALSSRQQYFTIIAWACGETQRASFVIVSDALRYEADVNLQSLIRI